MIALPKLVVKMAFRSGVLRLKPLGMPKYQRSLMFKTYIFSFVDSLSKGDRERFRFWCIDIIPRAKLDIDVSSDGDILRLIEFLQDDNQLSFTDVSLLKKFLLGIKRHDLLKKLKQFEFRIAVGIILEYFSEVNNVVACDVAYIEEFLVATRENNLELICQALEQIKEVDDDSEALAILDNVLQDCQHCPWSTVTTLLVIMGELHSSSVNLVAKINELFAKWMLKLGGLKAFEESIRKKQKITSHDCAMTLIGESLKEIIKYIGHEVDTESSMGITKDNRGPCNLYRCNCLNSW